MIFGGLTAFFLLVDVLEVLKVLGAYYDPCGVTTIGVCAEFSILPLEVLSYDDEGML